MARQWRNLLPSRVRSTATRQRSNFNPMKTIIGMPRWMFWTLLAAILFSFSPFAVKLMLRAVKPLSCTISHKQAGVPDMSVTADTQPPGTTTIINYPMITVPSYRVAQRYNHVEVGDWLKLLDEAPEATGLINNGVTF